MDEVLERAEAIVRDLSTSPRAEWRDLALSRLSRAPRGFVNALAAAYLIEQAGSQVRSEVVSIERRAQRPRLLSETPTAEQVAYAEQDRMLDAALWAKMTGLVEDYTAKLRLEWTAELLDSPLAMGDGTVVLWGDATIDQHRARYEMHSKNALAGLEGAARHRKAIDDIEALGGRTLRDVVRGVAA